MSAVAAEQSRKASRDSQNNVVCLWPRFRIAKDFASAFNSSDKLTRLLLAYKSIHVYVYTYTHMHTYTYTYAATDNFFIFVFFFFYCRLVSKTFLTNKTSISFNVDWEKMISNYVLV